MTKILIDEALAQPQQEPVQFKCTVIDDVYPNGIPLEQWTPPPQRKPLTRESFEAWFKRTYHSRLDRNMPDKSYNDPHANATWIGWQAAHGIKENT